jgi:hypothetical protein
MASTSKSKRRDRIEVAGLDPAIDVLEINGDATLAGRVELPLSRLCAKAANSWNF